MARREFVSTEREELLGGLILAVIHRERDGVARSVEMGAFRTDHLLYVEIFCRSLVRSSVRNGARHVAGPLRGLANWLNHNPNVRLVSDTDTSTAELQRFARRRASLLSPNPTAALIDETAEHLAGLVPLPQAAQDVGRRAVPLEYRFAQVLVTSGAIAARSSTRSGQLQVIERQNRILRLNPHLRRG